MSKLYNLLRGMPTEHKLALSEDLGITRDHLLRKALTPGRWTIDEAQKACKKVQEIYGADVAENIFELKQSA
jgi:hypothetical protein